MLLTDEEIKGIIAPYRGPITKAMQKMPLFTLEKEVAKAQHAQTLKAVADWSGVRCGDRAHEAYDKFYRVDCNLCMRYLVWNASEGQMPGEEK